MNRDEAIKLVRSMPCTIGEQEALRTLIPELYESEDEKIRTRLIALVEAFGQGRYRNEMLVYLEKQKEQSKEELVYRLNGLMQDYVKEGKDEAEKEHRLKCYRLFWDALEDASYFEQKEQKPAPISCCHENGTEWSEEDSRILYNVIAYVGYAAGHKGVKDDLFKEANDWLKALPERFSLSPKQEWSEDDEAHMKWLCRIVHSRMAHGELSLAEESELGEWMDKWLNHNPQPHWKPSEEQMTALDGCLEHWSGNKYQKEILESLYEQLKKLM